MFTLFTDIAEPMRNGFSCLNHGDDFVNNLMFNFDDEGNAKEIIFIDFQAALWASPGPDLLYFFISSLADDIKAENFDNFIEFYHEELVAALKTLKYEQHIPTLAELHIDVMDKGSYGENFGGGNLTHWINNSCIFRCPLPRVHHVPGEIRL